MAEILKYRYNANFINSLCDKIQERHADFNRAAFTSAVFDESWEQKELKERMGHIATCLQEFLPQEYDDALKILKPVSEHFTGFEPMIFPDFVERFGVDHYELSINALEYFTRYSSSEFAVRPFIVKHPEKMMQQMLAWADSDNHHVRRLASEGCRPRLPWAMALPDFKNNPSPILPILEKLKNDESEYVRRSVANNLNDIAKDNPDLVVDVATAWLGVTTNTDKLVKHACRTLLKSGNPEIMALFNFAPPDNIRVMNFEINESVVMGGAVNFSFDLVGDEKLGKIRIEFAIYFVKSNKTLSRKVFKVSEAEIDSSNKSVKKRFSFAPISTRKYYPGKHALSIIVNGVELNKRCFVLDK